ncbi:unnamed protein product, partial [Ixodes pacificus]
MRNDLVCSTLQWTAADATSYRSQSFAMRVSHHFKLRTGGFNRLLHAKIQNKRQSVQHQTATAKERFAHITGMAVFIQNPKSIHTKIVGLSIMLQPQQAYERYSTKSLSRFLWRVPNSGAVDSQHPENW